MMRWLSEEGKEGRKIREINEGGREGKEERKIRKINEGEREGREQGRKGTKLRKVREECERMKQNGMIGRGEERQVGGGRMAGEEIR